LKDLLGKAGEKRPLVEQGIEEQADGVGDYPHAPELPQRRPEDLVGLGGRGRGRDPAQQDAEGQAHGLVFAIDADVEVQASVLLGFHNRQVTAAGADDGRQGPDMVCDPLLHVLVRHGVTLHRASVMCVQKRIEP
jgi:hypothetical protein